MGFDRGPHGVDMGPTKGYRMWYVVCGMWHVACGMWCVVCGMWYVVCGMWYAPMEIRICTKANVAIQILQSLGGYLGKLHDSITKLQFSFSSLVEIRVFQKPYVAIVEPMAG